MLKMPALAHISSYLPSLSPFWRNTFIAIGIIHTFEFSSRVIGFFSLFARRGTINRYIHPSTYALVTGATGGIGKGYVLALLRRGCNVIIHGRNEEKLATLAADFQKQFPDQRILTISASAKDPRNAVPKIEQFVRERGLCITILINNVGGLAMFDFPTYRTLDEITPDEIDETMALNARFPVHLTSAMIPLLGKMQSESKALPSLIMNISSYVGYTGLPLVSVYAASKGANLSMSAALNWEMPIKDRDIEVLGILVGSVHTQGNDEEPASLVNPTGDDFAEASLFRVGCGRRIVWGWFWHALQTSFFELFSEKRRGELIRTTMVGRKKNLEGRNKDE